MNKTLMFVGAGPFQLPGILKAKSMGLRVVAIDGNPDAPGLGIADIPVVLDVKDRNGAIALGKLHHIDGVLTIASDIAVPTVAAVAEELGLPGIRSSVAEVATNKALMRKILSEKGISSPQFRQVRTLEETRRAVSELGLPVVIKPTDNAGSRGVRKISANDETDGSYQVSKEHSRSGDLIVEEFMNGSEVAVDGFIQNNKMYILSICDKIRTDPPFLLDTTIIFPTRYPGDIVDSIRRLATDAVSAMGLDDCPYHMEILITENGPRIVEVAARGAGFKVFSDIIPLITGVDTIETSIRMSLGLDVRIEITKNKAAVLKFFSARPGILKSIRGLQEAKNVDGVFDLEIYVKPGDCIHQLRSGADRIGHLITFADIPESALDIAALVESKITFNIR